MAPVMISSDLTASMPDVSTMELSYISTLQVLVLIIQANQMHIFPKIKIVPLISLGVLCGDGCTIPLEKKELSWTTNNKIQKEQSNRNVGSFLETQQSEAVANNILSQTTKPDLAQYLRAALFSQTTASLLKAIKKNSSRIGQSSQRS